MSDSQGNGWEGASATIFDCDGTYLANLTLEVLDSETVWLCLPGASDYGRLKVNVSSGDSPREIYWELTSAESQNTEMTLKNATFRFLHPRMCYFSPQEARLLGAPGRL